MKTKVLGYARVKDNFSCNDKGKEKFIGKVATVIAIEGDYLCFSQVRLEFMSGEKEWFSNTTLDEIEIDEYNCGDPD